jgi:hypothetical protein
MPAPSYPRGMSRRDPPPTVPPLPGGSRAAALYALAHDVAYELAGARHGVTRQAVQQAVRRLATEPRKPGRPASPGSRTEEIHLRLGKRRTMLRVTSEQLEAYRAAAPDGEVGEWFRALLAAHPKPRQAVLATHLRTIGDRAAQKTEP